MKFDDASTYAYDKLLIKSCLEKMDKDVATRFVLSAVSLSKTKIEEAFALACREMAIREENKKAKLKPELVGLDQTDPIASEELLKLFDDILGIKPQK